MAKLKKTLLVFLMLSLLTVCAGCDLGQAGGASADVANTIKAADALQANQQTPVDLEYSLERYNLIRRAYWVNGQRDRANTLVCEVEKPLGYVVLFSGSAIVGSFVVDGKVSSLNSYLTPDSEYYEVIMTGGENAYSRLNRWLADVDGTYGQNDSGIFFFTPDGKYIEWSGDYLYSDIPMHVDSPILQIAGDGE